MAFCSVSSEADLFGLQELTEIARMNRITNSPDVNNFIFFWKKFMTIMV
jgi:hypothetical protein